MPRDAAKDRPLHDARRLQPIGDRQPNPLWKTDIPHLAALAAEPYQSPLAVSLLDSCHLELSKLSPPQGSRKENGQHRVITLASERAPVDGGQDFIHLVLLKPVADARTTLFLSSDATDCGGLTLVKETRVRCILRERSNGRKAEIYCGRRVQPMLVTVQGSDQSVFVLEDNQA